MRLTRERLEELRKNYTEGRLPLLVKDLLFEINALTEERNKLLTALMAAQQSMTHFDFTKAFGVVEQVLKEMDEAK